MDGQHRSSALIAEQRGSVRYLTLNRPEVLNALNADVFAALEEESPTTICSEWSDPWPTISRRRARGPRASSSRPWGTPTVWMRAWPTRPRSRPWPPGRPRFSAYSASKAAIAALTSTAAVEWAKFGAQVNAVAPGYVETDMNADLRRDRELYARVVNQIPAKRMACAEEIGPLVVYLASPASDFLTGQTIVVDGGESAR